MLSHVTKYLTLNNAVDHSKVVDFGLQTKEFYALTDYIDTLTDVERIDIRKHLETNNINAPRSLYYNYKNQNWIG